MNEELDFSEDIIEVRVLRTAINIFIKNPSNVPKSDSYIMSIIYEQCKDLNDCGLTLRRICRMLPKNFYSLSFKISPVKTVEYLTSAIKLLNWKY